MRGTSPKRFEKDFKLYNKIFMQIWKILELLLAMAKKLRLGVRNHKEFTKAKSPNTIESFYNKTVFFSEKKKVGKRNINSQLN